MNTHPEHKQSTEATKRIVILGSTGSIGMNAVSVIDHLGSNFLIVGLSAHGKADPGEMGRLMAQIQKFEPEAVALWDEQAAQTLRDQNILSHGKPIAVFSGMEGLIRLASLESANYLLSSVVGAVGLRPLLAALQAGKIVALANKEALIMAGELVMAEARKSKGKILPVDSEHSAIFQCLGYEPTRAVRRLIVTASGGPFYRSTQSLDDVTAEQALAHPTWKMGKKITIDSATLMNKGIEMIEAGILFNIPLNQIEAIIHPQSIVHSLVEFVDSAVLAQLSLPDMCLPIQYSLTYPERLPNHLAPLNLAKARALEFYEPNFERFPCLMLAREAGLKGGTWPTVLNAADETVVHAFLDGKISFTGIARVIEKVLAMHKGVAKPCLEDILNADEWARAKAKECI
jgi:1-deoxy-D-xylulose-5-phosphate reductoisomerase